MKMCSITERTRDSVGSALRLPPRSVDLEDSILPPWKELCRMLGRADCGRFVRRSRRPPALEARGRQGSSRRRCNAATERRTL